MAAAGQAKRHDHYRADLRGAYSRRRKPPSTGASVGQPLREREPPQAFDQAEWCGSKGSRQDTNETPALKLKKTALPAKRLSRATAGVDLAWIHDDSLVEMPMRNLASEGAGFSDDHSGGAWIVREADQDWRDQMADAAGDLTLKGSTI